MSSKSFACFTVLSISQLLGVFFTHQFNIVSAAEGQPVVKVSDYARADDLVAAQKYFLAQLEEPLASKPDYAEDTQERVKKNALVLAVLTMQLGLHDTLNPSQSQAAELLPLTIELAASVKEYDRAKAVFDKIQAIVNAKTANPGPEIKWAMVRGQGAIMKKMNEINAAIKRNLTPTRFDKQLATLKHQTATMAALGQATFLDKHHVKDPTEHPTYEKYAVEFRTAAAELNTAIYAADQAAALKAFARMDRSCHTCHQKFDPPKN